MKNCLKISILSLILSIFMSGIIFFDSSFKASADYVKTLPVSEIVIEKESGKVLFENNADLKRGIASTTKILTAIVAIENCDVNKIITVDDKCVGVEGSSIYLKKGERYKVEDLLYGLMLRSGNDAAVALAVEVGGSLEGFVDLMNMTAQMIGAKDSHFSNPHGLSSPNHYSTARDLAAITSYALKNETFKKIVSTKSHTFEKEDKSQQTFINKNKMLKMFEGADGVKTGYTKADGRCLVSSATRNGVTLISVVLGCGPMFERSCELLENGFNQIGGQN